jgi:hypothetical protein
MSDGVKKSFVILETTNGIQVVGAADTRADAEAHLERIRHQWRASSRFEIVSVPMRGRVEVPNAGDYSEADLEQLARFNAIEDRKQRFARAAGGEEELS